MERVRHIRRLRSVRTRDAEQRQDGYRQRLGLQRLEGIRSLPQLQRPRAGNGSGFQSQQCVISSIASAALSSTSLILYPVEKSWTPPIPWAQRAVSKSASRPRSPSTSPSSPPAPSTPGSPAITTTTSQMPTRTSARANYPAPTPLASRSCPSRRIRLASSTCPCARCWI